MIAYVLLFLVALVAGVALATSVSLFLGKRVQRPDGRPGRRRGPLRIVLGLAGLVVVMSMLAVLGGWFYANAQFDKIARVDVDGPDGKSVLEGNSGGTNWLLVGTDAREGTEGNRSDTMLILRTGDGPAEILSIPRDTLVPIPSQGGEVARINSAYNDGPVALIQAIQEGIGIPIDRYIEIDFGSFGGLVDALGGVTINFPNPAIDTHSGLNVEQAGDVNLSGEQALAYVRSRFYQEVIDGVPQPADGLGDLSRVQRQQTFLRAVIAEAGASKNPFHLNKIGNALIDGLRIDNHMQLIDGIRFALAMGSLNPEVQTLPVQFIEGSGAVDLAPEAEAVIVDFSTKG